MKHKVGDRVVATNGVGGTVVKAKLIPAYEVDWDGYTTTVEDKDISPAKEKP